MGFNFGGVRRRELCLGGGAGTHLVICRQSGLRGRRELGFNGIIICDDFSMGAVSLGGQLRPETAAVRSLAAGTDMVLVWPPDLRRTHREIQAALKDGRLSRERLREAAGRIIFEKIKLGIINE